MKYRISTGCCLLLHLTTFVFASPPPKEDLTYVLQTDNIDHLLPSNDQSQQSSSDGLPPITLTCQPSEITANVQQNASKRKAMTYSELKASDNPDDQKRFFEFKATNARRGREMYSELKASDNPEDQKRFLKLKASKGRIARDYFKRLRTSDNPEDQKRLLKMKTIKVQKYKELKESDKPEDQERFLKLKTTKAERYRKLKESDKPEDQERFRKLKTTKRERYKELKESEKPEDQERFRNLKARNLISARKSHAKESNKGLAGSSTQKHTQVNFGNLVGTSDVHVPSHTKLFGISISNFGPAQESQIQNDEVRYASKRAERNADTVCRDSNNLGRETELERPLKRKKVNSGTLELSPVTDDSTCIGLGTSEVHVPSHTKLFGISISNIGPAQESQIQYDEVRYASERAKRNADAVCRDSNNLGRETELAVGERPLKRKKVNSVTLELSPVTNDSTCIGLGTSEVHVPSHTKLFGIIISNIGPTQESQIHYDGERHASERAKRNADAGCKPSQC